VAVRRWNEVVSRASLSTFFRVFGDVRTTDDTLTLFDHL